MYESADYVELHGLSETGFHINSIVAIVGFILSLFMFIHTLYEFKIKKQTNRNSKRAATKSIIYSSLAITFLSLFTFTIYCVEFFFLRLFPPHKYNYSAYTFCNRFTPFMFVSIFCVVYGVMHYFLLRLEGSFKGSALAYPNILFIILRIIAVLCIITPVAMVIIATDGLPYNVRKEMVTNDKPWLCRNGIKKEWPGFWDAINGIGVIIVIGGNCLNWYLFMNRLGKLIELGLSTDDSFISYYSGNYKRDTKQRRNRSRTASMDFSNTLQSDTITYSHVNQRDNRMDVVAEMTPIDEAHTAHFDDPELPDLHEALDAETRARVASDSAPSGNGITNGFQKYQKKRKQTEEERQERKRRRARKERILYELIKRQSILTGIVCITGVIFWFFQIAFDEGSTMTLSSMITCVICVYLSFGFKIKCFEIICGKCMDDCTCIEDRIERKIAKDLGLQKSVDIDSKGDDGLYKE